ncbi:hypothetical protein [Rhodoferax sp. AJA081-3]|uniref:hypothetical protein n=1 Tax=Rhodoferax sp. AJA081-3 TaxID=2752316 RepID=UPI001FD85AD3|nr:hypothetical protein [Rhodoferax sp. AJA081-3]
MLPFLLRIAALNVEGQPVHFFADLDTKRAGLELVQNKLAALRINFRLLRRGTHDTLWAAGNFPDTHDGAQQQPHRFEK